MNVKRFFGETARDCLRQVKEALGPDAIVVSNKAVPGGVEIMAMSAAGLAALSQPPAARQVQAAAAASSPVPSLAAQPPRPVAQIPAMRPIPAAPVAAPDDDYTVSLSAQARQQPLFRPWQPPVHDGPTDRSYNSRGFEPGAERAAAPAQTRAAAPPFAASTPLSSAAAAARPRPLAPKPPAVPSQEQVTAALRSVLDEARDAQAGSDAESTQQMNHLMDEMHSIKALLEQQLAGFAWGEMARNAPLRAQLLGEMLDAGFSGQLARRLTQDLPAGLAPEAGRKWLQSALNRRLRTLSNEDDLIERGGVYALVGPTGVGKTTTTAKLAARCVVRHGASKLALLTTDGYRIGAHEQLRIYGRILGVPVHVVRDGEDLRHTLADLRDKHMIIIDTVGMSQRDRMVAEQAAMLVRAGEVRRLLLLNATSRGDTLDDVVRAYAGEDLAGCILTKVDETVSLAPALDAVARHGLLLAYIANGQRVPEDMHLPNRNYLLHRAFKQPIEASPHRLRNEEAGLMISAHGAEPGPRLAGASLA
jgi:flagellar biosynthesis protein FlhF